MLVSFVVVFHISVWRLIYRHDVVHLFARSSLSPVLAHLDKYFLGIRSIFARVRACVRVCMCARVYVRVCAWACVRVCGVRG